MSTAPVITIFVRHSADCKYAGDEFSRRCQCRKHFRWTRDGKQHRQAANTRSWAEAEEGKRSLTDQLSGNAPVVAKSSLPQLQKSIEVFLQDKAVQGISADVIGKYTRELERLKGYCEGQGVFTVQGITRELLTGYSATWEKAYPSSQTRAMVKARCRNFLRYCHEAEWIPRIPPLPKIKVDEAPTMPLSGDEYARLLIATDEFPEGGRARALFQLMRHSGLAIRDSLTLERAKLRKTASGYGVLTSRQKTGTHVYAPLPNAVAEEVLAVQSGNPRYIFWEGESDIVKHWTKYIIPPIFKKAEIEKGGNMMSHRLRDTFAVDLLEKGVPMEELSKLLGHTSIKTTERSYAKWVKSRQDRLEALVRATWA